jgi:acyl carrier protein
MRSRLQRVFREVFDDDALIITPETSYETLKGWDSMAQVKLIMALEEEFGIKLSTDEVVEAASVEAIEAILNRDGS